jgi:large subunit ribosomal protein L20
MPRVKNGPATRARRKKILKMAKGYVGSRSRQFKKAKEAVTKALKYAYRDRRAKKRDFRALWISRINAAVRAEGFTYGRFIDGLNKAGVVVDRKMLAELAINEPASFSKLVELAKQHVGAVAA